VASSLGLLTQATAASTDCPTAPASPKDRRTNQQKLRVVTFNAEWLFLDASNCPGSGCAWANSQEAQEHLSNIADIISYLDADIVNLVEVQDCNVLNQLIAQVDSVRASQGVMASGYLPYLVKGTDTATQQNVAIITRVDPSINMQRTSARVVYPVPGSECYDNVEQSSIPQADTTVSKHYFTRFDVLTPNKTKIPIVFIGLHFVAIPDDPTRCSQREGQATVIQDLIQLQAFDKGITRVVVLGDYNDYDPSVPDPAGDVPISHALEIIKDQPKRMYNLNARVTTLANRWSCLYDKNNDCKDGGASEHTLIDHVVVSEDVNKMVTGVDIYHGYPGACELYSDHYPIIVDLDVTK